jgi:hypothetical protein
LVVVSALVKLPDFLPGLGTLYVDRATLRVGPHYHIVQWLIGPAAVKAEMQ